MSTTQQLILHKIQKAKANIHRSFKRLKYQKKIPCSCESCQGKQEPHFYAFDTLLKFKANGQYQIQCQKKPYKMVDVLSLIDDIRFKMPVERIRDRDRAPLPAQKPPAPSGERNAKPDSPAKSPNGDAAQKNWVTVASEKVYIFFTEKRFESYLAFSGSVLTVSYATPFVKSLFWLALIIFAVLIVLMDMVSNKSTRTRVRKFCVLVIIAVFAWLTLPPNLNNSCPNVELMVSSFQIEPGETADLSVFPFPKGNTWNYTWKATSPGLKKEGERGYGKPNNEYTAPIKAEEKKVTITVHVHDNQCGKEVSDEVSITLLLPDN